MKFIVLLSVLIVSPSICAATPSLVYSTMVADSAYYNSGFSLGQYAADVDPEGNMYIGVPFRTSDNRGITIYKLNAAGTDMEVVATFDNGEEYCEDLIWSEDGLYIRTNKFESLGMYMTNIFLKIGFDGTELFRIEWWGLGEHLVDCNDNLYLISYITEEIAGTISTTPDAFDTTYNGDDDIAIQKYDPDGNLIYGSFLGGSGHDRVSGITSDEEGRIYLSARVSDDFPYPIAGDDPLSGGNPCIIILSPVLDELTAYYSGSPIICPIVHQNQAIYTLEEKGLHKFSVTGEEIWAMSLRKETPYIWWPPAKPAVNEDVQAIIVNKDHIFSIRPVSYYEPFTVTPDALYDSMIGGNLTLGIWQFTEDEELLYGTYFGGEGNEETTMNAVAYRDGRLYVAGFTNSNQFPLTPGAYIDTREHQFPTHGLFAFCIDFNESTGIADETGAIPTHLALDPPHPNPFNPQTTLSFMLPEAGFARLAVYNLGGQLVRELTAETLPAGRHEVIWDGRDSDGAPVSSGVYIARLAVGGRSAVRKVTLVR